MTPPEVMGGQRRYQALHCAGVERLSFMGKKRTECNAASSETEFSGSFTTACSQPVGVFSSTHSQPEHKKSRPIRNGFLRGSQTTIVLFNLNPTVSQELILPGIELFSQGATPQISSPLLRFTTEFEMDRSGTTALWTPG